MKRYGIEIILIFGLLCLIAFSAKVYQTSRNAYYDRNPIQEIVVTAQMRPEPGSIRWRINQCKHFVTIAKGRVRLDTDSYLDCREQAVLKARKDI